MIKINFIEPETETWKLWVKNCREETEKLIKRFENGEPIEISSLYRRKVIKDAIYFNKSGPFYGKCAYCECYINDFQHGDTEHFRPKGKVTDENDQEITVTGPEGEQTKHPGYFWLAYDWQNLLPSCQKCNQPGSVEGETIGKQNRFPVEGRHGVLPGEEKTEKPLLLHPVFDDPEEHLYTDVKTGLMIPKTKRGNISIKILGLNVRDRLPELRKKTIVHTRAMLVQYVYGDKERREELFQKINARKYGNREYTSALRTALRDLKGLAGLVENEAPKSNFKKEKIDIPAQVRGFLRENCSYMEVDHLQERGRAITVGLSELFIPLYTDDPDEEAVYDRTIRDDKVLSHGKKTPVDITELVAKKQSIVIEGAPGSGKSTLLKYLTYTLADEKPLFEQFKGYFPALIILKHLNEGLPKNGLTLKRIFEQHYTGEKKILADLAFKAAKQGLCLLMLDGLDEIEAAQRDLLVDCVADFKQLNPGGNKYVLAGRPHGVSQKVLNRFNRKNRVIVNPLEKEQKKFFIHKWFSHLLVKNPGLGRATALDLIRQMKSNEPLKKMVDTPLMLTAVCILYHNGKRLPQNRGELYKRFTEHLVWSRFEDPEKVISFLSRLADNMQDCHQRSTGRAIAVDILKDVYEQDSDESDESYRARMERLFDFIEPRSGLLAFENGAYKFSHLTFQEFLAAVYIKENNLDYIGALAPLWELEHYRETLPLFIALVSLDNKQWANEIVRVRLNKETKAPFLAWQSAIRGFLDIHRDRQDTAVAALAKKQLLKMFDADIQPDVRAEAGVFLSALGDPRNLKEMVFVPGGEYKLAVGKEKKVKAVKIEEFEIGKYPVTNAWFKEFIDACGYKNDDWWTPEGINWRNVENTSQPSYWTNTPWNCSNHPVVGVTWFEAAAFCNWLTASSGGEYRYYLPSAEEWEAAAAGFEERKYPWGNRWADGICNSVEAGIDSTTAVGAFPKNATPEGIMDMGGNVWEWTSTNYDDWRKQTDFLLNKSIVISGGAWFNPQDNIGCRARIDVNPFYRNYWNNDVGFRITRTKITL